MPLAALVIAALIVVFIGPIGEVAARQFERMFGSSRESGARWARISYLSFAALLVFYAVVKLAGD